MASVDEHQSRSHLAQWIKSAIGLPRIRVQIRLRGNVLHILCEGESCPDRAIAALSLVRAMQASDINTLLPATYPPLYQVMLYGRAQGQRPFNWVVPLYLNQLDQHRAQLQHLRQQPTAPLKPHATRSVGATATADRNAPSDASADRAATASTTMTPPAPNAALVLSTRSLAKQGTPDGIARYLSEVLNTLGISVHVSVKALPMRRGEESIPQQRLWILCEAPYCPDPVTVAEPTAKRLRELELDGFRDAVILIQVQGEPCPDWFLRVDLTPQAEMLREWARWGDVAAIARLLQPGLAQRGVRATAELRGSTLHLVCQSTIQSDAIPNQHAVRDAIAPLLEALAPQGIHAATLYGQDAKQNSPAWVDWMTLPAAEHPALGHPAWDLAKQGDLPALSFLITRHLNPNLEWQLATGGIRTQVLRKADLLHIMADAPVCPKQRQVAPSLAKLLRQLQVPNVNGARIYGRRSGQKIPLWSYGVDFRPRQRVIPEAAPEFSASDAYVGDLLSQSHEDVVLRPDLTADDVRTALSWASDRVIHTLQGILIRSQVFAPRVEQQGLSLQETQKESVVRHAALPIALVWGAVGCLLMAQTDWILGQILRSSTPPVEETQPDVDLPVQEPETPDAELPWNLSELSFGRSVAQEDDTFDETGFTGSGPMTSTAGSQAGSGDLQASPTGALVDFSTIQSPYPTFNSRQLDEKIALYYERLAESGPPDVLVLGSSRALRGVDPAALEQALEALGYADVSVFNFGINGATAQVFDFVIRRVLTPDQLPKLILIADGARAFNSGRVDITYNAIVVSEGYKELDSLKPETASTASSDGGEGAADSTGSSLSASYQAVEAWIEDGLSQLSAVHPERDRLKQLIQQVTAHVLKPFSTSASKQAEMNQALADAEALMMDGEAMVDFDGFLPLSVQFNPATYYQNYARVSGDFDGDYEAFDLKGDQAEAFMVLLDYTQAQGIPVVLVNTPLTDEYLDPARLEYEQQFQKWMLSLAATESGFVFRDLGQLWTRQYNYFSDPSHLNRYGAYQVSNRLAQDPMIPWPRSQNSP